MTDGRRCHLRTRLCSGEVRLFAVDGAVKGLCAWHSVGFRPAEDVRGVPVTPGDPARSRRRLPGRALPRVEDILMARVRVRPGSASGTSSTWARST